MLTYLFDYGTLKIEIIYLFFFRQIIRRGILCFRSVHILNAKYL